MQAVSSSCHPPLSTIISHALSSAAIEAGKALTTFTNYVTTSQKSWSTNASIGEANYLWYLRHVSFVNYTVDELRDIGRQQLARANVMLAMEKRKNDINKVGPLPKIATSLSEQINATKASSIYVRTFLNQSNLFQFPAWFGNDEEAEYKVAAIPACLAPFTYSALGEEDDFTTSKESSQMGGFGFVRYVPDKKKVTFFS